MALGWLRRTGPPVDAGTRHNWWKAPAARVAGGSIGLGRVLVIEDQLGVRPAHGFIAATARGTRSTTEEVQVWVLELAGQTRAARKVVAAPILV